MRNDQLSLCSDQTMALQLKGASAACDTGTDSPHRSNRRTKVHPRSNDMTSDYYELYNALNRKTAPLRDEYNTSYSCMYRTDAFWKSRGTFIIPKKNSTFEVAYEAQNSITPYS